MSSHYIALSAAVVSVTVFSSAATAQAHHSAAAERKGTPFVLQPNDGEHRMRRSPPSCP
jgi:hypothetical protein